MREIDRGDLRAPACVLDLDLADKKSDAIIDVTRFATAWCLIRHGDSVVDATFLDVSSESAISAGLLRTFFSEARAPVPVAVDTEPVSPESLTVVIPTNRGGSIPNVLKSLAAQSDQSFDVLIVDNSSDGHIGRSFTNFRGLVLRTHHEPRPGLSRARNAALTQLTSELVAWIDDDEEADADWVAWIRRGFAHPSRPVAVVGAMVPAELETPAQVDFERYGGFNKGRPMQAQELRAGSSTVWDPLFPLPSFGAGGNMAFRTEALRAIGGFDPVLGSPAIRGGEETRVLSELLERGAVILHWPHAVTWHHHRRSHAELERQFYGYSAGLSAFYVSAILASPRCTLRIFKLLPRGLRQLRRKRRAGRPDGPEIEFPREILRSGRRGLYLGGWIYLRERYRCKRELL